MVKPLRRVGREILLHVARYRLTTAPILAVCDLLDDSSVEAAQNQLQRLSRDGWLQRAELSPEKAGVVTYELTPKSGEELGLDVPFARALKWEQRLEAYAVARFCCCGDTFRQLFTKAEYQDKFGSLWFPGQPVRYYLEPDERGSARLAYIKVDKNGSGRWDRLIDSCGRFVLQRTDTRRVAAVHRPQVQAFAQLVERQRFQISVLTGLVDKKRAIELELARRVATGELTAPICVYVVPELFELGMSAAHRWTPPIDRASCDADHVAGDMTPHR